MPEDVFGPEAWAPLAKALVAHSRGDEGVLVHVHVDDGEADPLPAALFFRSPSDFREADREALERAEGRVLDVGACVGSIALALQEKGFRVTALEVIPEAVEIMVGRGVEDPRRGRVQDLQPGSTFDTILVLMNGIALAGSLSRVPAFLRDLGRVLADGGQILVDSTDLLEGKEVPPASADHIPVSWFEGDYPGELQFQMEFDGVRGAPFPQLFLDSGTLTALADVEGFETEVVWRGGDGGFLTCLRRRVAPISRDPGSVTPPRPLP